MKIANLCTRRVVIIDAHASLAQAATLMREHHVGALVVTSQGDEGLSVLGLVTDRDLVLNALARELDPADSRIGTLASTTLASVSEDDDVRAAITTMQRAGVRRLLVTDADGRLDGIVSLDDVVQGFANEFAALAGVIRSAMDREVSETRPTPPLPANLLRIPSVGTAGWGHRG